VDFLTLIGAALAIGSILGGQILEGGHVGSIVQATAFIIVMGGTLGAVCIQNPLSVVLKGVSLLSLTLFDPKLDIKSDIARIIDLANLSRKQGLLALEGKIKDLPDPFFKKGVQFIVDGTDPKMMQEILETEVDHHDGRQNLGCGRGVCADGRNFRCGAWADSCHGKPSRSF
jgi:chemotaxis protein MotA